jgi:hypothetical protein
VAPGFFSQPSAYMKDRSKIASISPSISKSLQMLGLSQGQFTGRVEHLAQSTGMLQDQAKARLPA